MPLDKILHKIQIQIDELAPVLETFLDSSVQPSVSDCENLQKQLSLLQENVAVYKYNKQNKELSPSFNIHARISAIEKPVEKIPDAEPRKEPVAEVKQPEPVTQKQEEKQEEIKSEAPVLEPVITEPVAQRQPLAIGLNDKFRFINTLFMQSASEYNAAIEQLGNLHNWYDTELYLNSLKSLYDWKETSEVVKQFYALAKKQFS